MLLRIFSTFFFYCFSFFFSFRLFSSIFLFLFLLLPLLYRNLPDEKHTLRKNTENFRMKHISGTIIIARWTPPSHHQQQSLCISLLAAHMPSRPHTATCTPVVLTRCHPQMRVHYVPVHLMANKAIKIRVSFGFRLALLRPSTNCTGLWPRREERCRGWKSKKGGKVKWKRWRDRRDGD